MSQTEEGFEIAQSARLLTPDAPGAKQLWEALQEGASLRSSPLSDPPMQILPRSPQRVFCESSGSSGAPKLIRRSPESWRVSFEINRKMFHIGPQDRYAVLGHLGHSLSLFAALEALHIGAGLALLTGQGPKRQAAALRTHKVTTIYATPSQLGLIVRADADAFADVRRIFFGGGKMDAALRATLSARFPEARLMEFFGASETSFITISDADTPVGSVGRPYPGVGLRIGDTGALDEVGDIWVKSLYLFEGYEEGDSPLTEWRDGFLSIGEMGRLDADGFLYLVGRRSRMVTVADQNVFPEAIEAVLSAQPYVESVAVITPSDPLRGVQIVAAVVGQAEASQLRHACRAELGDAAVPRAVWVLPEMPMLPAGKPDLRRLDALWREASR